MFRGSFHFRIGYDEVGLTVHVIHRQTQWSRTDRPKPGESVSSVKDRAVSSFYREFVNFDDFAVRVGRAEVNGQVGDWWQIEHVPTGRKNSINTATSPDVPRPVDHLFETMLLELWREGLLPNTRTDVG